MAQAISGGPLTAHRCDQPCDLSRAPRHQRTFERRKSKAIKHPRSDADHILCRRADFAADKVTAIVEADQVAGKGADDLLLHQFASGVDHHTVRHTTHKFLHMTRSNPHGHLIGVVQHVGHYLRESAT